jgi:hypothetical protein|tara:strand:+ start:95 stop:1801 length:1707 start_codon:yes stop_codon:yes gene_type:complete
MLTMNFIGIESHAISNNNRGGNACVNQKKEGDWTVFSKGDINITNCFGYLIHHIGQMILPENPENLDDALRRAKGTFAYYVIKNDKLYVGTDPMGFYPLYYTKKKELPLSFSTSITHLKRRFTSLTPNWDAWNLLLNGEDLLGEMTTINEFSRLREGEVLCYSLTRTLMPFSIIKFPFYKVPEQVSESDFIEEGNAILSNVVSNLMGGEENNLIPLTAGHDSRRIANTAHALKIPFSSITQSTRHATNCDVDSLVGKQTADIFSLPKERYTHLSMPDNATVITQTMEKDYWSGFETPAHEWSINMLNAIPNNSLICDGIVGDQVVTSSVYYNFKNELDLINGDTDKIVDFIVNKKNIMPFNTNEQERRRSLIEASVNEYAGDEHTIIKHIVFNHSRRNTAAWYYPFMAKGNRLCLPFADVDFFQHGLSMSLDRKKDVLWQQKCLAKVNPELASLHSTRDRHSSDYWKSQGAEFVPNEKLLFRPEQVKIPNFVLEKLDRNLREKIIDTVGLRFFTNATLKASPWRYLPLQRLAMFLDWLDEDESGMQILSEDAPPFLEKRSLSPLTVTK